MVSVRTVRRFILGCQGLWPGRRSAGRPGTRKALHQSGLVQVDPLNVVGRSHDLALHARVWDYRPEHLDHLLYKSREFFDYGGTLYVLPMGELPYWRVHMARRAAEEKQRAFAAEHKQLLESLREDISARGPVANRDYAGQGQRTRFRSDKDTARALRHLWLTGELMTYGRRRFERLYGLRDDVAPVEVRHAATADEADDFFARKALAVLGLATVGDWARRFRHLARLRAEPEGERRRLDELLASGVAVRAQVGDGPAHYLLGGTGQAARSHGERIGTQSLARPTGGHAGRGHLPAAAGVRHGTRPGPRSGSSSTTSGRCTSPPPNGAGATT